MGLSDNLNKVCMIYVILFIMITWRGVYELPMNTTFFIQPKKEKIVIRILSPFLCPFLSFNTLSARLTFKRWERERKSVFCIIQWIWLSWLIVLCLYKKEAHVSYSLILTWLPPTIQMAQTNVISLFVYSQSRL